MNELKMHQMYSDKNDELQEWNKLELKDKKKLILKKLKNYL